MVGKRKFIGLSLSEIVRLVYRHPQIRLWDVRRVLWRGADDLQ